MTRWNFEPLYPKPKSVPSLFFPVAKARKFSTVFGVVYKYEGDGGNIDVTCQPSFVPPDSSESKTDLAVETNDDCEKGGVSVCVRWGD
jgi:hypothetical protein